MTREEIKKKWKQGQFINIQQRTNSSWQNVQNRMGNQIQSSGNDSYNAIQGSTIKQTPRISQSVQNQVGQIQKNGLSQARMEQRQVIMPNKEIKQYSERKKLTKEQEEKIQEAAYQYKKEHSKGLLQTPKAFADNDISENTALEIIGDTAKTVGGTVASVPVKVIEGATKVTQQVGDLVSYGIADIIDAANKDKQHALRKRVQGNVEADNQFWQNYENKLGTKESVFGEKLQSSLEGVGQSGVYAGMELANPILSTAAIVASSAGGTLQETYAENPDIKSWQAWLRAGGSGAISAATEKIFKVFGVGGSGIDDALKNELSKQFSNGFAKWAARTGVSAAGEGAEEGIEYFADYVMDSIIDKISKGETNFAKWDWEEFFNNIETGALSGGISEGSSNVSTIAAAAKSNLALAEKTKGSQLTTQETIDVIEQTAKNMAVAEEAQYDTEKAISKTIKESGLDKKTQKKITDVAEENNLSLEQVNYLIENTKNGKHEQTTIQNEPVLNQEQQIIQEEQKQAQNETSQQPSEYTTNLMKSIDNYNNSRQEGQEIFDINNEETRKEIESIQKVAENRGINITFDENRFDNADTNAFYEYDEKGNVANIVLNPNSTSKKYVQNLVIHEMTHSFEGSNQYKSLSKAVLDFAKSKGEYDNAFKDLMNTYSKVYSGENLNEIVEKEAVANILGEKLGDKEFVDSLVNNQYVERNIIQKIIDFVKNQINRFKGYKDQEQYWNNVKTLFEEAYNKSEVSQEGLKDSVKRYSINGDGRDFFYRGQEKEGKDLSYNSTGFMGLKDGGYFFTPNKETANKYGNNIIERYRNEENTVTVKESDELQKMATEKLNEDMKNGVWTEEDDLLEQMSLGRSKAFAEYTGKPFVETGDMFGEDAEAIYYPEFDKEGNYNIEEIEEDNKTDTEFSKDTTGAWNNFIEKYFKNEGEGTAIKDLKKLPERKYTMQDFESVLDNSKNIPVEDKKALKSDLESIELNKKSLDEFTKLVKDLDKNYFEYNESQIGKKLTKQETSQLYRTYQNKPTTYKKSSMKTALDSIQGNRYGRTKAEWLQVAELAGVENANLTPQELDKIVNESWFDLAPNTKSQLNRQGQGYVEFTLNDWRDAFYKGVKENRQYSIDTENTPQLPKAEEVKLPKPQLKENPQLKVTPENEIITEEMKPKTRKEVREMLLDKMDITADDLAEGKDISSINYQLTDPVRVNEKVFGRELGKKINDATINQTKHNTAEKIRWQNKERKEISDLGIKARSKESAAVQKYGEKQWVDKNGNTLTYGDEELARDFKDTKTQEKIKHAAEVIRQKYDTYIDQINEVLTSLGYDAIPKRPDYMRHFQELNDIFSKTGVPFNLNDMSADVLPTDINGLTEFNKPGKNWFASAQKRYGNKTTYDAITGIDGYLEGAGNLIFHTQDIQNYRALSTLIRDTFGATKGFDNLDKLTEEQAQKRIDDIMNNKLSNYAAWLDEQANSLAGKKGAIDRGVERFFGRRIYSALNTLKSQTGSNMTGFNIRSALTNFISVTQAASKTQKKAMIQGTLDTIKNIFHKDDFIDKSDFLTSRFGSDTLSKKIWQKASNAGQIFMSGTDYFTANLIARSKYYEGLDKGMTEQEALDYSNDFASRVMGDRSQGSTAEAFNSKTLGFLTQFQLETNNQWQYMIHDTKMDFGKEASKSNGLKAGAMAVFQMGQIAAYSYFFNELFEKVAGSRAAFDPVDIIKKLFGLDDKEDEEKTFEKRMQEAAAELADSLPLTSLFGSGGRLPISEALQPFNTVYDYITGGTNKYGQTTQFKNVGKDFAESIGYLALPTGYGQLKKTIQGLEMYNNELPGSYTDSGNLRYTVDKDNKLQKAQAAIFGKWANEYAKDYIESGYKTIAQKQIQELKDLGMNSTEYRAYRKGLAQYNKQADKINYINSLNLSDKQKTIMANNVLDSDKYKVDMSNYNDFDSFDEFKKYYQDLYKNKK